MQSGMPISFSANQLFLGHLLSPLVIEAMVITEALTKMETLFCYIFLDHQNSSKESQVYSRVEIGRRHARQVIGQITVL